MVKESISRNYVLEMQAFNIVLAMITQLFIVKLLILVLAPKTLISILLFKNSLYQGPRPSTKA